MFDVYEAPDWYVCLVAGTSQAQSLRGISCSMKLCVFIKLKVLNSVLTRELFNVEVHGWNCSIFFLQVNHCHFSSACPYVTCIHPYEWV